MKVTIWPGSILVRSTSTGAPAARARSEGAQEAMKGTAAKAAPTTPVAVVAKVRKPRRSWSTSGMGTTASIGSLVIKNSEDLACIGLVPQGREAHPGPAMRSARHYTLRPQIGRAHV